jgi:uncharacterized repeat protein (TIGR02543 family)
MKNRHFWIIALVAIMAFAFTACDNGNETKETFTVTFNANGGTPTPQNQTITKGEKATEPQGVIKVNTTLDGWYTEAAFSNKWNFTNSVTESITLYAKWICNCNPKDHLGIGETCDCGSTACDCTVKEYGKINGIPVYRAGITDAQMAGVFDKAQAGYDGVNGLFKPNINTTKVSAIHMVADTEANAACVSDGAGKYPMRL